MTDPSDKQRQRDRYLKGAGKQRSRGDEQRLRLARQSGRTPRQDDVDEDAGFQKIQRRDRVLDHNKQRPAVIPNASQSVGTVVWLSRGRAQVRIAVGERVEVREAQLAPELAQTQQTSVAVGDDVTVFERPDGTAVVVAVAERRSELTRTDPNNAKRLRVLAANVDLTALVLTADRPRLGLVDRLRLALADSGAELVVCINKCDLAHDRDELEQGMRPHRQANIQIVNTSATEGTGVEELRALVSGRTVAFVGHSGVGKSTLLNRLDPDEERQIGAVRKHDGKGRHTTTASRLTVLADGTRLIDTPGVRAFGLAEGQTDALAAFEDVAAHADGCRFRDCLHDREPGCAVRAAVDAGELPEARHAAWLRMQDRG